jgi:hypothetical protein
VVTVDVLGDDPSGGELAPARHSTSSSHVFPPVSQLSLGPGAVRQELTHQSRIRNPISYLDALIALGWVGSFKGRRDKKTWEERK